MGGFATRDPATSAFWDERYRAGYTPWDARGVPPALTRFIETAHPPGRRVLVPGCGSAYEAGYLDALGFDVTAIDIAPEALARAREVLGDAVADRVLVQADLFTLDRVQYVATTRDEGNAVGGHFSSTCQRTLP